MYVRFRDAGIPWPWVSQAPRRIPKVPYAPCEFIKYCVNVDFVGMRDRLCSTLESVGVPVVKPHSGYFVLADFSALQKKLRIPDGETADYETCR